MKKTESEYTWVIDPIDGTKNYISGIPIWGTLIALFCSDDVIMGVSHVPMFDEMLWAEKGKGAFLNYRPVGVSNISDLKQSKISFGSLGSFKDKNLESAILPLIYKADRQRSIGDLWPYHLLSCGKLDIVAEAAVKIMDIAPFGVIIPEAGGRVSDLFGNKINFDTATFLATNGRLHDQVVDSFIDDHERNIC